MVVSLRDLCIFVVSNYLSPHNIWHINRMTRHVHCKRVEQVVHMFICDNFMESSHNEEFLSLDESEISLLLDNQDIRVSEPAMLDSLARWFAHSKTQRVDVFRQLYTKVNVDTINENLLSLIINKYKLYKVIRELRRYKKLFPLHLDTIDELIHRENIANISVIGYSPANRSLYSATNRLNFNVWMPMTSEVFSFYATTRNEKNLIKTHSVVSIYCELYIFSIVKESDDSDYGNLVTTKLNLRTGDVVRCATLTRPMYSREALFFNSGIFIYVFGRFDVLDSCSYRYDTTSNDWKELTPMIHKCISSWDDVVCYNNRYLYVIRLCTCERYDMHTNTWAIVQLPWGSHCSFKKIQEKLSLVCKHNIMIRSDLRQGKIPIKEPVVMSTWHEFFPTVEVTGSTLFGKHFLLKVDKGHSTSELYFSSSPGIDFINQEKDIAMVTMDLENLFDIIVVKSRGARYSWKRITI